MEQISTTLTLLLKTWIGRLIGAASNHTVVGSLTLEDLAATLCFVLLTLIVNALALAVVRRHAARPPEASNVRTLRHHTLRALGRPLYALIWVCGAYLAITPLLLRLNEGEGLAALRALLGRAFDLGAFAVLFWCCFRFTRVLETHLALWASRTRSKLDDLLVPLLGRSLRVLLPVIAIIFALPILNLPPEYADVVAKGTSILLIVSAAVILFQAVRLCETAVLSRFDITAADNLRAREVYTQIHVISKVVDVIIGLFTVACVLMLFAEVRHIGASLLASAGIVGIIAGIAAQKTIANLFAGFQIALTQPIRQDDVVVVEGEWGRVEEITLTYVVVHIWDDRRLVLPLSYFIEKPFQNWTRKSANLLGSIIVWVDYSFPVDEGRAALKQIIESSPLWDKRFWNLQVSDADARSMQLRVLATSGDSSSSWDLRCEIREKFIAYIQKDHPHSLPQLRAQVSGATVAEP